MLGNVPTNICSIAISNNALAFAVAKRIEEGKKSRSQLMAVEHQSSVTSGDVQKELSDLIEKYGAFGMPCVCVLHPSDYQLVLVDKPHVPESEMADALKWSAADRLGIKPEASLVQTFGCPHMSDKIFACITEQSLVVKIQQWLLSIGLKLHKITITELALANAMLATQHHDKTIAMLHFVQGSAMIMILNEGQLCSVMKLPSILGKAQFDPFINQIKRLLVDAQSQGLEVSKLWITPGQISDEKSIKRIDIELTCPVDKLDMHAIMPTGMQYVDHVFSQTLAAVGGVMIKEG